MSNTRRNRGSIVNASCRVSLLESSPTAGALLSSVFANVELPLGPKEPVTGVDRPMDSVYLVWIRGTSHDHVAPIAVVGTWEEAVEALEQGAIERGFRVGVLDRSADFYEYEGYFSTDSFSTTYYILTIQRFEVKRKAACRQ